LGMRRVGEEVRNFVRAHNEPPPLDPPLLSDDP